MAEGGLNTENLGDGIKPVEGNIQPVVANRSADTSKGVKPDLGRVKSLKDMAQISEVRSTPSVETHPSEITIRTNRPANDENPTVAELIPQIDASGGRIPYSKFMDTCLFGRDGYYTSGRVDIGLEGDFITFPEASPVFGAGIAEALRKVWEASGEPENFRVIEMGAGKASLASALLSWAKELDAQFYQSLQYTILEYGHGLIPKQQERLDQFKNKVTWVRGSAYSLPFQGVVGAFISNELPDAFPVEIVKKVGGELKQKYIGLEDNEYGGKEWTEVWSTPDPEVANYIQEYQINVAEGTEEPINAQAALWQKQVDAALLKGAVITIDYGKNGEVGDKEAVRFYNKDISKARGYYSDSKEDQEIKRKDAVYGMAGKVDLTTSVNFRVLEKIAQTDGLQVGFSGQQQDFFRMVDTTNIERRMERKINYDTDSFQKIAKVMGNLRAFHWMHEDAESFYAQMLLKGIDPSSIEWTPQQADYEPGYPELSVNLGKYTGGKVEVRFNKAPGKGHTMTVQPEANGDIIMPLDRIEDTVYISQKTGDVLLDLRDKKELKRVVEEDEMKFDQD